MQATHLRLFLGSDEDQEVTLDAAFRRWVEPDVRTPGTLSEYHSSLRHWEREMGRIPACNLTNDDLGAFQRRLLGRGLKPVTVAKIQRTLMVVMGRLFAPDRVNPRGLGIIPLYLAFPRLQVQPPNDPRVLTNQEVVALYQACHAARWPIGGRAPQLWQTAIVAWVTLGPRCYELWGDIESRGWQWRGVDLTGRKVSYVAYKTGRRIVVPLAKLLVTHLERLQAAAGDGDGRCFPATLSRRELYRAWNAIVDEAAKQVPSLIENRPTPHDLRRTCQTCWDAGAPNPLLGSWIMRRGGTVADRSYRYLFQAAIELIDSLPVVQALESATG